MKVNFWSFSLTFSVMAHVSVRTCLDLDSQIESDPSILDRYSKSRRDGGIFAPGGIRHHSSYSSVTVSTRRKPDGVGNHSYFWRLS